MKKNKLSIKKAVFRTVPLIVRISPLSVFIFAMLSLLYGVSIGVTASINQYFYDSLADAALNNGVVENAYIGAVILAGVLLLQQLFSALHGFVSNNAMYLELEFKIRKVIHSKVKNLPAQLFESKKILEDIEKAGYGMLGAIFTCQFMINIIFFYGAYFLIMGGFLFHVQPILVLALLFVFAPVLLVQIVEARLHDKLEEESAPIRRQNAHYEDCLIGIKLKKETRLFGAYGFFKDLYMDSIKLLTQKEWKTQKKVSAIYLGLNFTKAAGWIGILVLLFYTFVSGDITVGAFAAVYGSISTMFGLVEQIVQTFRQNVTQRLGQTHNLINLLDMKDIATEVNEPDFSKGIVATGISFAYPDAEKNAVDNVTLSIHPGETLALVGENGSGKTTLVKLLCGLYKPNQGQIKIGGENSVTTADSALFAKTSGIFQNYVGYALSLEENVLISQHKSKKETTKALDDADVDYNDTNTFPNGLETYLTRDINGVELSGGGWQRVATARGLYREHDFIVLDEPTAAIDPIEETRIYKRFAKLTRNKMAVLVTHRLGSARIADRIVVMEAGKIVEIGTHESLLGSDGVYAKMWAIQAESLIT